MQPLLSAALIVRDEAHHLPDCLRSLDGLVDEVVIVDTGSTDGTVELARAAGARVLHHPWAGDFATPRNHGLDACRGRWILYIDADERLRPIERQEIVALLDADDRHVAFRVLLRPRIGWTPYLEFRLWRNDPRIRFRNVIHEQIVGAVTQVGDEDGLRIGDSTIELDHVGYEGDQRHKHERNLPLLRARLVEEPSNVFNWRHLASVLAGLDQPDASLAALREAVSVARAEDPASVHGGVAFTDLIALHLELDEPVDDLLAEAEARYPTNLMWPWFRAQQAVRSGRFEDALATLDRLLGIDLAALPAGGVAYDGRIFGAGAHAQRGLCLFRLGRFAEAARAYAAAEALEPDELEHRVKRQLAEARA